MKIAIVVNPIPKTNFSTVVSVSKLITIMPDEAEVSLFGIGYDKEMFTIKRPFDLHSYPNLAGNSIKRILSFSKTSKKMSEDIKSFRPDVVLFWVSDKMKSVLESCRKAGLKTLLWVLADYQALAKNKGMKNKFFLSLYKGMVKKTDYLAGESPSSIVGWPVYNKDESKIFHLPIYADFEHYGLRVPYSERENNIVVCSRLGAEKNIDSIIEGFKLFKAKREGDWKLEIIGDGPLKNDLESKYKDDAVFDGWQKAPFIAERLNNAKLYVIASKTEGLPSTIQEAMICGVPALATYVGGLRAFVKDGENGYFLKSADPSDICEALTKFVEEGKGEELSRGAIKTIQSGYTFEMCKKKMAEAINIIIGSDTI